MSKNGNYNVIENMLMDMRHHVSGLQEKLSVADAACNKSQTVNEKILTMKEYQDKVSTMNSCWRSKNRKNLVSNLQHENRQMIALEEENRQLRFSLKEMEEGLHLIMAEHRRLVSSFNRSDLLLEFAKNNCQKNKNGCVEFEKLMEFANLVNQCMNVAEEKIAKQDEIISRLQYENTTFRELAYWKLSSKTHAKLEENVSGLNDQTKDESNDKDDEEENETENNANDNTFYQNTSTNMKSQLSLSDLKKNNNLKSVDDKNLNESDRRWPIHVVKNKDEVLRPSAKSNDLKSTSVLDTNVSSVLKFSNEDTNKSNNNKQKNQQAEKVCSPNSPSTISDTTLATDTMPQNTIELDNNKAANDNLIEGAEFMQATIAKYEEKVYQKTENDIAVNEEKIETVKGTETREESSLSISNKNVSSGMPIPDTNVYITQKMTRLKQFESFSF